MQYLNAIKHGDIEPFKREHLLLCPAKKFLIADKSRKFMVYCVKTQTINQKCDLIWLGYNKLLMVDTNRRSCIVNSLKLRICLQFLTPK